MSKKYLKVKIDSGHLNLRSKPNGEIVGKLNNNEIVRFEDIDGDWVKICTSYSMIGYAHSKFLEEYDYEKYEKNNKVPEWLTIAEKEIGVKEIAGNEHNERILEYHRSTKGNVDVTDELPWCASFVNWCVKESGLNGTDTKRVKDWMSWGKELKFEERKPGAIVVFKFNNGGNHVAFLKDMEIMNFTSGQRISCIGGNQGDQVKYSNYLINDIVSIRWPV